MKKLEYLKNILFSSAFLILVLIAIILIFSSTMLLAKVSISNMFFIVSGLIALAVYLFIYRFSSKLEILGGIFLSIIIFMFSLFASTEIYDLSHDSNWYHKAAVGCLANGYNPCYEDISQFATKSKIGIGNLNESGIWVEHYCKASWIFGANIYSLTNDIETAKSLNILMVYVLFSFTYFILSKWIKDWQGIIIAFLAVFNPIVLSQVFSLYIDNLLMTTLFIIIVLLIDITYNEKYVSFKLVDFISLFSAVVICINIKFTGLAYSGIFCFSFYLLWLIFSIKDKNFKKVFILMTSFYAVTCIIAIMLVGFSSYVLNFVQHGHPLYPLAGNGKVDIMTGNQPSSFDNMIGVKKLIYSVFSETDNIIGDGRNPKLKMPFSVNEYEIQMCKKGADIRIGGFGPLFSGILCICAPIIFYGLFYLYKKNKKWFYICFTLLGIIACMLLLIQESWWARYSPYFYIVPLMALSFLFVFYNDIKNCKIKVSILMVILILGLTIFTNSMFFVDYAMECKKETVRIKENLAIAREISSNRKINIKFLTYAYYGLEFNFRDNNINYKIIGKTDKELVPLYSNMAEMEVIDNE